MIMSPNSFRRRKSMYLTFNDSDSSIRKAVKFLRNHRSSLEPENSRYTLIMILDIILPRLIFFQSSYLSFSIHIEMEKYPFKMFVSRVLLLKINSNLNIPPHLNSTSAKILSKNNLIWYLKDNLGWWSKFRLLRAELWTNSIYLLVY